MVPKEEKVKEYVAGWVEKLAKEHGGAVFEAHMTLVGDVELPLDEMKEMVEELAKGMEPMKLITGEVSYSTTYYQCVFVRLKAEFELMEVYVKAREMFGLGSGVFMPHMSLLYGDLEFEKREKIVRGIVFEKQEFGVDRLVITPGGENPPDKWEHLVEIELGG
jgi:hypothetical protein